MAQLRSLSLWLQNIHKRLIPYIDQTWAVALSGGLDSSVLLHVLSRHPKHPNIQAYHVHHGLQSTAHDFEQTAEQWSRTLGIPYQCLKGKVALPRGTSPEAQARDLRYALLWNALDRNSVLITAHHLDDQVETLLLRLLRGSGPQGLSGMRFEKNFSRGLLLRPFLETPKSLLIEYARQHAIPWIEDPSNESCAFDRNFLRHEVLPLLEQRFKGYRKAFSRSARLCADSQALLETIPLPFDPSKPLNFQIIKEQSPQAQLFFLKRWLEEHAHLQLSEAQMLRLLAWLEAEPDRMPEYRHPQGKLRMWRHTLYWIPHAVSPCTQKSYAWNPLETLALEDGSSWSMRPHPGRGFAFDRIPKMLHVRPRSGGEHLLYHGHHRPLKKLFSADNIPPWIREQTPLFWNDQELVAVGEFWVADPYRIQDSEGIGWMPTPHKL